MIKGLLFDLDGTILDSNELWQWCVINLLESYGVKISKEYYHLLENLTLDEAFSKISNDFKIQENLETIFFDIMANQYATKINVKPGVINFIKAAKSRGLQIIIVTASKKELFISCLEKFNIINMLDDIKTTVEYNTSKASSYIYDIACTTNNLKKDEVIVFEDALYAIKTLHNNNYNICGVYDKMYSENTDEIKNMCNCYISDWLEIDDCTKLNTFLYNIDKE